MAGLGEAAGLRGGAIGVAVFGVVATFTSSLDGSLCVVFVRPKSVRNGAFNRNVGSTGWLTSSSKSSWVCSGV